MRSGFFNDTDVYAEDFARFAEGLLTSGVLAKTGAELLVSASEGMSVSVAPGYCWIEGHFGRADEAEELEVDTADGTYTRIDRVVARLDRSEGSVYLHVVKGTPAAAPAAPDIVRDGTYYDLGLATIRIPAGTLELTSGMITDTRRDKSVCGGAFSQNASAFVDKDPPYNPAIFPDRNLNEVFAEEIAQFSSVWAWIGNRFATKNLADIYLSDYFVFEYDNKTWHARLQKMYVPCGDDTLTAWGDFMCDELLDPIYAMGDPSAYVPSSGKQTSYNNGMYNSLGTISYPWLTSHLYFYLNSATGPKYIGKKAATGSSYYFENMDYSSQGVWYSFPQEAKNVIVPKKNYIAAKIPENAGSSTYNETPAISDATGLSFQTIGNLWVPSWRELVGVTSQSGYPGTNYAEVSSNTWVYKRFNEYSSNAFGEMDVRDRINLFQDGWLVKQDQSFLFKLSEAAGIYDSLYIWLLNPHQGNANQWDIASIRKTYNRIEGLGKTTNELVYVPLCFRIGVPTT